HDRRFSPLQFLGAAIGLASLVLVVAPTLVHDPGPAPDLFEATERHVRWGLGISLGAVLVANRWRRPWSVLLAWVAFCGSGGYLLARFVGIAIEGPTDIKQWALVGVEIAICGIAALWIRHRRNAPDRS
ncbi:MAG: hypothetical protein AAGE52_38255, partial [Myxococcota bacterium]